MAVGKTNAISGTAKIKYILANEFDANQTYYERILTPYNPSRIEGTYLFVDKSYCGSIRVNSDKFYGIGDDGGIAHAFILGGKEPSQTTSGEWSWISNFKVWKKSFSNSILVNYRMDNGGNNGGDWASFYSTMPNNFQISYSSKRCIMSIFDSSEIGTLRDFTDLCTVKVSDYIMGTDYQNIEELLSLVGKTSIETWINELTSYNEIELTQESFVAYKYYIKAIDE